jgi:flagellar basal-body rod protein FlgG
MSAALEIAAVGMRAHQAALDIIAGNISNMNTTAYKRSDLRFSELLSVADVADTKQSADFVSGVLEVATPAYGIQGQLDVTGSANDLAIDGQGFLELIGPGGKTLLWRGGALKVLEDGHLGTASGYMLKAAIAMPQDATSFAIARDGTVTAVTASGETEEVGRLDLARAADGADLVRLDGGLYQVADEGQLLAAKPGDEGLGELVQASLERSNVDLNREMVDLLVAQRAYAANAQVLKAADEINGVANGLRR